jgi:general L-amino acid transport system permease protein
MWRIAVPLGRRVVAAGSGAVAAACSGCSCWPGRWRDHGLQSVIPLAIQPVRSRVRRLRAGLHHRRGAIALSLPLGIMLALGGKSDMFLIKSLCVGFIEFIRGVPLITLLFTASLLLNYFLPPGTNFDIILRV